MNLIHVDFNPVNPHNPKGECIKQMGSCKTNKIGGHCENYSQISAIWNVFAVSVIYCQERMDWMITQVN